MARLLGDLAELTVGHVGPMASEYVQEGIPFLRSLNIRPFRIDLADVKYITPEFHSRLRKSALAPGDVVVVRTGAPGTAAVIPDSLPSSNCSDLVVIRPGKDLDSRYLAALINGISRGFVFSRTVGAVQQHFNVGSAREIPVPDSSLEEQRRIAGVLGAFDDLIDTNTQLADQMDTLLSAVVQDALDRAGESEPLSSYADFVNGRNFTKGADGTGRPVIRTPEVRLGPSGSTPRSSIDAVDANVARSGDTLFVWSGSLTLGRWRWEDGLVNQHVFKVIPRAGLPDWLPHQLTQRQLPWFLSLAADKATTMGHIQRRHLDAPVPALETSVLSRLDEIAGPLWAASLDARTEADRLAGARDQLLPLLMSGRITVDEVWEAAS